MVSRNFNSPTKIFRPSFFAVRYFFSQLIQDEHIGNCYDNAYCESCFSLLKREELELKVYGSMNEARRDVFEWIEAWYNTHRLYSTLGYRNPVDFEKMIA